MTRRILRKPPIVCKVCGETHWWKQDSEARHCILRISLHVDRCAPGVFRNTRLKEIRKPGCFPYGPLPIEVWERIFDLLAQDEWVYALRACALTCRLWSTRCRWHLTKHIVLREKKQAHKVAKVIRNRASQMDTAEVITLRQPFAFMSGKKLSRVKALTIGDTCDIRHWMPGSLHVDVFTHFRITFDSLTRLTLDWIEFPSVIVLARLVFSFPRLTSLTCHDLSFKTRGFVRGRALPPKPFELIQVDVQGADDVVDFLIISVVGATLQRIKWKGRSGSVSTLQRLLQVAGASLRTLDVTCWETYEAKVDILDLGNNDGLEVVSVTTDLDHSDKYIMNWNWTYGIMSTALPSKLREIVIGANVGSYQALPQNHADLLARIDCVQLEELLCQACFENLETVHFHLRGIVHSSDTFDMPVEKWMRQLSRQFPGLHARKLLQASVAAEPVVQSSRFGPARWQW
ncbi:uncharacterized protein FIBRA_03576 [Fibroporia radiculosa]|uniref:F-box domain-containing protein n=1 Tax=Fibroporia radiculosa TaxID=599839 RepID=J4GNJ9_9APHY|nr:uncharacterized protein FIBRA_03576 [Fibroporia radiculosa]CCM01520.1 predicted protein [Fibroporia radiculosa]